MSEQPRLIAMNGPDDGQPYPLDRVEVTLGRDPKHTVPVLWDGSVSRDAHACVFYRSGLYWLKDTGSRSGTYVMLPGAEEPIQLSGDQKVLLLDQAVMRLGRVASFQVVGVTASMNDAVRVLLQRLDALRNGLPHLPPEAQERQRQQVYEIECKLQQVQSEEELLALAADGIATVSEEEDPSVPTPPSPPEEEELPLLPEDLPEPGSPDRLPSLQNVFLARLRPIDGHDEEERHDERPC